ncbi:Ribokinase-like protein [Tilletiaria anomala UBC 951]|uniref:Adenosine kinase n=1 Tax=Tilletiaria anomala (strain ATCC 24038 / CBS 436.72 / UBC 951) TaxID=1037660 RepID=A0A066VW41_TILAU|nr:Ribokinase-like protein [Tilletiaria anomala UBC 951]KDN45917.1 Ribokinase-like protein [Tilletiaria anomala UBC 951]
MPGNLDLVALGNPLLDMQIRNGESVLEKYNLKANDAILAEESHMPIYSHIVENFDVVYVAGGAAQNAARCAQYILPGNSTVYLGCVGKDDLAEQLRKANEKEGLKSCYQVVESEPTGSCAVVITGHNRSLVTRLGAAEKFSPSHLATAEVQKLVEGAKMFYLGGFFLTHGIESALIIAKAASKQGVPFTMNLSAPFIPQFFKDQVDQVLPYASVVVGNESEFEAYAASHSLADPKDLKAIAQHIADLPATFGSLQQKRYVVCTNGAQPTILAVQGESSQKEIPTAQVPDSEIVDTNGAGDAFAGGVLGALLLGKTIEQAVEVGQKLGRMCIGQVGPMLKFPKEQIV